MKTKLALIALVSAVVIFPAVFFRTPPPTVPGLARPVIDRTVFDAAPDAGNIRNRLQAKAENAEGDDDAADEGDGGGGFFSRLTNKDEAGDATKPVFRPGGPRADKSKVLRPRMNRPVGGDKIRPNLKTDSGSTRLKKRQDMLAKRRAQREQAQDGSADGANVDPAIADEPPLPEIDIPHEEPLPDDYGMPDDGQDDGAIE
ncbi:MAG: hypothetical protein KJ042_03385 [Deltaproteobacteria bacterium]|nr:hypothetical protein [Deltaproteobacteria bacterium]